MLWGGPAPREQHGQDGDGDEADVEVLHVVGPNTC